MEALLTIVGGIGGTILGFLLSEWAQTRREKRSGRREAASVRTLLRHEASMNLQRLEDLWRRIMQQKDGSSRGRAKQLIELPFAGFTDAVWKSQLSLIPSALDSREINVANTFYERLHDLEVVRESLAVAYMQQKEDWSRASGGTALVSMSRAMFIPKDFDRLAS